MRIGKSALRNARTLQGIRMHILVTYQKYSTTHTRSTACREELWINDTIWWRIQLLEPRFLQLPLSPFPTWLEKYAWILHGAEYARKGPRGNRGGDYNNIECTPIQGVVES